MVTMMVILAMVMIIRRGEHYDHDGDEFMMAVVTTLHSSFRP